MGSKDYTISINVHAKSNFGVVTKKLDAQLKKMDDKMNRLTKSTKTNAVAFGKLNTAMTRLAFVAIPAVGLAFRSIMKEGMRFETATKNLSALTGIQGSRLDELTSKASDLSVQWGLSADNIVSGMKRIASNKSEFIKVAGAIEQVSEASAVLARASGLTFHKSGEVITQTMNQFKMGLGDTNRIINTFAEGAKLGSFEIDKLAQVFSRSGGAMKSIGADFEDAMAISMVGSRLGLTGEMVGTQLKTGLLRLAQKDDIFNPLVVGFENALENLHKAKLKPSELMAIFGLESFQVAQAFTEQIGMFKEWKKGITGTNTAYLQSAINMQAMSNKLSILSSKFAKVKRDWFFDEKTQSTLNRTIDKLDQFLDQSTWQARLLKHTFIGLGNAIVFSLAVFGAAKFGKAIKLLWGVMKLMQSAKVISFMSKTKGLGALGKILKFGIVKLLAFIGLISKLGDSIGSALGTISMDVVELFNAGEWLAAGIHLGRAFGLGLVRASVQFVKMLLTPFIALEEITADVLGLKGYDSEIGKYMDQSIDAITHAISLSPEEVKDERARMWKELSTTAYAQDQELAVALAAMQSRTQIEVALADGLVPGSVETNGVANTTVTSTNTNTNVGTNSVNNLPTIQLIAW